MSLLAFSREGIYRLSQTTDSSQKIFMEVQQRRYSKCRVVHSIFSRTAVESTAYLGSILIQLLISWDSLDVLLHMCGNFQGFPLKTMHCFGLVI